MLEKCLENGQKRINHVSGKCVEVVAKCQERVWKLLRKEINSVWKVSRTCVSLGFLVWAKDLATVDVKFGFSTPNFTYYQLDRSGGQ